MAVVDALDVQRRRFRARTGRPRVSRVRSDRSPRRSASIRAWSGRCRCGTGPRAGAPVPVRESACGFAEQRWASGCARRSSRRAAIGVRALPAPGAGGQAVGDERPGALGRGHLARDRALDPAQGAGSPRRGLRAGASVRPVSSRRRCSRQRAATTTRSSSRSAPPLARPRRPRARARRGASVRRTARAPMLAYARSSGLGLGAQQVDDEDRAFRSAGSSAASLSRRSRARAG